MKKVFLGICVLLLCLCLSGCSSTRNPNFNENSDQTNLEIGNTANYESFAITLLEVEPLEDGHIDAQFKIKAYDDVLFEAGEFSGVGNNITSTETSFYLPDNSEYTDSFKMSKDETTTVQVQFTIENLREIILDHEDLGQIVESSWSFPTV